MRTHLTGEFIMAETVNTSTPPATGKKFANMSAGEKVVFIGKSFVFLLTAGFAFPTIWSD